VATLIGVMAVVTSRFGWISADGGAAVVAASALATAAVQTLLLRRTRVVAATEGVGPAGPV
jgi:hypothetical protein